MQLLANSNSLALFSRSVVVKKKSLYPFTKKLLHTQGNYYNTFRLLPKLHSLENYVLSVPEIFFCLYFFQVFSFGITLTTLICYRSLLGTFHPFLTSPLMILRFDVNLCALIRFDSILHFIDN